MTRESFIRMMDQRLRLVRAEYGLTQEKMAAALGISKKTLVEIEKGRRTLGWTGAAALAAIFGDSSILQNDFGGEPTELLESLAFAEIEPDYPRTMGGRVWWKDVERPEGFRIQQNIISGHYRLLDSQDRRLISSFDPEVVRRRLEGEKEPEKQDRNRRK